jgi:glutathione S-transferase
MKLIGSTTSPYVRKVRIVMAEKKLDFQFVNEDVWAADTNIAASNPLGKVPCLVMEGGEALFDSRVIVEYVDTLSPVGKLIPGAGRERAEVKTWEALSDGLLDAAILARLEATWPGRKEGERSQAWIDRQLKKIDDSLSAMDRALAQQLCGHSPELGRHRGGRGGGVFGFPFPADRLACTSSQLGWLV